MIPEPFRNDSGIIPRSLRTSRARADQGAGSRERNREIGHLAFPTHHARPLRVPAPSPDPWSEGMR